MAIAVILPAMNGDKSLHPFFTKPNGQHATSGASSGDENEGSEGFDGAYDVPSKGSKPTRKRKSKESLAANSKSQRTLQQILNPALANDDAPKRFDGREIPISCSSDPIYMPAPKRRRTSPIEALDELQEQDNVVEESANGSTTTPPQRRASPQVVIPASSPLPTIALEPASDAAPTAPRKMLRLNASGKFSSPPTKKAKDEEPNNEEPIIEAPKRRGRPRKFKGPEKQSHVVIIRYDDEGDKGAQIDRILSGEERVRKEVKMTLKKQRTPRKQDPSKPTHPFFIGKPNEQPSAPKQESPRKTSAITPGKLRTKTLSFDRTHNMAKSNDTWTSTLLKDRMIMKHPGAMEPAWPTREEAHVRGLDDEAPSMSDVSSNVQRRKRKTTRREIATQESLLNQFASQLTLEEEGALREDGFREPHPSLRLPEKLLIPGQEILERVSKELSTAQVREDADELSSSHASVQPLHPAILALRTRILNNLTAFDEGSGENHGWVQKYAPTAAAEVLQPGREIGILKIWLNSLTVTSVESALRSESRQSPKPETKPKKKRRRKNKELDDFLVDSDEEVHDMDELTDPEDKSPSSTAQGTKSVVQTAADGLKLSNAVLLTGPHGCGKTAAAYAVARDLGFKVFEISSSEKRSGKDVLDKVGDMAENHLVKHHGTESGYTSAAEEPSRNEEAFQRDLASGRQGKMDAFFTPKATATKTSPKKKQPKPKIKAIQQLQQALKKPPKDQQQSLILLEEVDILFKDDKDFWSTVLKLISTSKRPFIMTCNDEDLVPLQAMTLHAILRFSPPPIDLATDYLLAMAAAEGHLIKRDAISSLYRSKDFDFRATITELDFWCQMGVGDPRVGLSWIYQRYPPGSDLDQQGRRLRIVSQSTFQARMGHTADSRLVEEDQALWALESFGVDPLNDFGWNDLRNISSDALTSLKRYEHFASSLSAADVYTAVLDAPGLDKSQPPMSDKARTQYIEGMPLLQTDEMERYDTLMQELATVSSLAACRVAGFRHTQLIATATSKNARNAKSLTRRDFTCFDIISVPSESVLSSGPSLSQSAFDGPLEPIAVDLAPYVRSILQYEAALSEQHERLNSILGDGHPSNKRMRTTRAARSALQGGQRSLTRREKWFTKELNAAAVLATGGKDWPIATAKLDEVESREGTETPSPSAESA